MIGEPGAGLYNAVFNTVTLDLKDILLVYSNYLL